MNLSPRDRNNLMMLGAVLAVAVLALSFKAGREQWEMRARQYAAEKKKLADRIALIASRAGWESRYEELSSKMPVYAEGRDVAVEWLRAIDEIAERHRIDVSKRQVGKEAEVGDVFELPVDFKNWSGTLKALVSFLYDVNSAGAMLDIHDLAIQPEARKPGYLKGNFTLNCAYMRGEEEAPEDAPAETVAEKTAPAPGDEKAEESAGSQETR